MSASSQNPPGAQPPNPPYAVAVAAAQTAPVPPSAVQLAAGVIRAAMANDCATAHEIAQAEQDAGILFDPQRAEEIASAARADERGKCAAELTAAAQDRQARDWFHDRWRAVGQLCEGRPLNYMVEVGEVLTALDGRAPKTLPLTIRWDGSVNGPSGDGPGETTLVGGTTARGGRAVLVLDDDQGLQLGDRLLATLHATETCHTPGCGEPNLSPDEADHPAMAGWISVEVAGIKNGPRWWCNPACAYAAITAGGTELKTDGQAAAVDPRQQAYAPAGAAAAPTDATGGAR